MGRKLKYRAYSELKKKMFYWPDPTNMTFWKGGKLHYFDHDGGRLCLELSREMQYTGLKDKNGVEIYEDDIVRKLTTQTPKDVYRNTTIVYKGCAFKILYSDGCMTFLEWPSPSCLEVIGNIHENPPY